MRKYLKVIGVDLKVIGAEAAYLLTAVIVAGIASMLQMAGRTQKAVNTSFIFREERYSYNMFFYILGFVLFAGFLYAGYRFFLKERIALLWEADRATRVVFVMVAILFAMVMWVCLFLCAFMTMGLNIDMEPAGLLYLTLIGWPFLCAIFMIGVSIYTVKFGG